MLLGHVVRNGSPSVAQVDVKTSDTDDDDSLYYLADPDASMAWSDQERSDTNTDSQWDDPEWHKNPFSAPSVQFHDVNIVPLTTDSIPRHRWSI